MIKTKYKLGYSDNGGIFIGKNIQSIFHKHHSIAIILSFKEPFEIINENNKSKFYEAALIPKDISYKLSTSKEDFTVFIHLDPYSEVGITLAQDDKCIQGLNRNSFLKILHDFQKWFEETDNTSKKVQCLLENIVAVLTGKNLFTKKIDDRVLKCIQFIRKSDTNNIKLEQLADYVSISPSRLYHLFKQEIGITIRRFLQHCKLVKSIKSIYNQQNLTEATFFGGFSDQPHFNKTFKKTFGIKPSLIKNS